MDKRTKKRLDALKGRLQKLEQLLAAAKRQPDDPGEISRLEREVADVRQQIAKAGEG